MAQGTGKGGAPSCRAGLLLVAGLLPLLLAAGCGDAGKPAGPGPATGGDRILVIAIDGLEPSILGPLARDGRTPHLAGLMERGRSGVLETLEPTLSPIIWTTIGTGKPPAEHGITDFSRRDPATGEVRLLTSRDRQVPAVWTIASAGERRVDVVGWWNTWPAEPVRGRMVAQYSSPLGERRVAKGTVETGVPGMTWPGELITELAPLIEQAAAEWPDPDAGERTDPGGAESWRAVFPEMPAGAGEYERRLVEDTIWAFRSDAIYAALTVRLLRTAPADLTMVYLGSPDVAGHRFFRHYRPGAYSHPPDPGMAAAFADVIPATYAFVDGLVGLLLAAAGPDASILVLSDHGMAPVNVDKDFERAFAERPALRLAAVNAGHHLAGEPGAFIAAGPLLAGDERPGPAGPPPRLGSVFDVTPTLLHMLDLPVGADMPGRVLTELLASPGPGDRPVRFRDSHDPLQDALPAPSFEGLDAERLRQLRSLGYVE